MHDEVGKKQSEDYQKRLQKLKEEEVNKQTTNHLNLTSFFFSSLSRIIWQSFSLKTHPPVIVNHLLGKFNNTKNRFNNKIFYLFLVEIYFSRRNPIQNHKHNNIFLRIKLELYTKTMIMNGISTMIFNH